MTKPAREPLVFSRAFGLALICTLLWSFAVAASAAAAGTGVILGRITNGTPGGSVAAGRSDILLGVFEGDALKSQLTAQADSNGDFRFDGLEVGDSITYSVATIYANAVYKSDPVRLSASEPEQKVDLKVFEAVASDPGLRAGEVFFVLDGVDADRQEITVSELVTLVNPSDHAFVPGTDSPSGPQGLIRFGLPAGARDLQAGAGLTSDEMAQVSTGFASFAPVPPGSSEFGFSYHLPYSDGQVSLDKSLPYGAELLEVLAPEQVAEVTSKDLTASQPVDLDSVRLQAWVGRSFAPDSRVKLTVSGLPTRPLLSSALVLIGQPVVAPALLALGLAFGILLTLRVRLRHSARGVPLTRAVPDAAPDGEDLVEAIARLDDAFAAGGLSEADYRATRMDLKGRLQALMVEGH